MSPSSNESVEVQISCYVFLWGPISCLSDRQSKTTKYFFHFRLFSHYKHPIQKEKTLLESIPSALKSDWHCTKKRLLHLTSKSAFDLWKQEVKGYQATLTSYCLYTCRTALDNHLSSHKQKLLSLSLSCVSFLLLSLQCDCMNDPPLVLHTNPAASTVIAPSWTMNGTKQAWMFIALQRGTNFTFLAEGQELN